MKKTIFTFLALLSSLMGNAQQSWDFTSTNSADVTALSAATTEWTYTESSKRYENINAIDGALKAGETELLTTKGLLFKAAAKKLRIDVDKRVQLAGKNVEVTIPNLKKGQQVTISFASTGTTALTLDNQVNLENTSGFTAADKNTTQSGTGTVAADGNVTFSSTVGSVNIFSISVSESGQQGGGDDPQPEGDDHSVAKNLLKNQAGLKLFSADVRYYNTDELSNILVDNSKVTVTTSSEAADIYDGRVSEISFCKKSDEATPGEIENVGVEITEAAGWQESLYLKWSFFEGATSYNVYVKGGKYADFTKIDQQLVRKYSNYGRADVVGLVEGSYEVKVVPVTDDAEVADKASLAKNIMVRNYDRSGFAHFNYTSGVGAYNDDGSLKAGAVVIYVTAANAKTVKATLSSGEFTGLQGIVTAFEKGNVTTPLAIRFIGTIKAADVDEFGSSAEGIQVKGRKADSELNITFEGIGDDATIQGFGFLCRNSKSVEFRNFGIMRCMDDGISLDTDNSNIWIHNIDVYYGKHGSGDHAKGDGAIDVKSDSKFVTLAYCHFWDTGKSNMFGMKSESGPNYITYHHNWFDHSDSRHPRIRTMSVHVHNNYYDGNSKYGVGVTTGASCFAENNYFRHTHDPLLSSQQGTDAKGDGTFSGENGGIIKSFGNIYAENGGSSYYVPITYQTNNTSFDCYEAATRDEQVPATVKTLAGGTTYDNFDTDASKMYSYTPDATIDVPAIVTGYYGAGRMNHGDCQFTFNNATDDTDYAVNSALETLIDNYKSGLVAIYGDENAVSGEQGQGVQEDTTQINPVPVPEGIIFTSFSANGTPSNSFFTVTGSGSNSKGEVTIDGVKYGTCLKMEKDTKVSFTITKAMTMTLYFGPSETASIEINGNKITGSGNTYTQQLEAGNYKLTKDKSVNLFGIKLEPVEPAE